MNDLRTVSTDGFAAKAFIAAVAVVSLFSLVFAFRWQVGNMLAIFTGPLDPNAAEIARTAVDWAPSDPAARWLAGSTPEGNAVAGLEQAVRLAPFDTRWRVELARAYEQDDRLGEAEAQFRQAIELAPNYAA